MMMAFLKSRNMLSWNIQ